MLAAESLGVRGLAVGPLHAFLPPASSGSFKLAAAARYAEPLVA